MGLECLPLDQVKTAQDFERRWGKNRKDNASTMKYFAHTANNSGCGSERDTHGWQALADHLRQVAALARKFGAPSNLGEHAEFAGFLHDFGKYSERFQARLRNPEIRGINHWAAGAALAGQMPGCSGVAFAVDGHHTGIPAKGNLQQTLRHMKDQGARRDFTGCEETIEALLHRMGEDGLQVRTPEPRPAQTCFAESLRVRMLFSCLVDADFLDTEAHFEPEKTGGRQVPVLEAEKALGILTDRLSTLPCGGAVNERRAKLLSDCLSAASHAPGLFTLTAPTGSGKTLSSLAFALRHITQHNAHLPPGDSRRFRRIITVIPFTSIIEQVAAVYRSVFEPFFGPDYVLEHHSSVAPREQDCDRNRDAENERIRRARLAAENWESPLVVTTNVQFFESLFGNRPSECRKLHNIARSVVLFDEVQTLPADLVPSLLSAVKLLTQDYGVTAVFMTATQPAFAAAGRAVIGGWEPTPIESEGHAMAEALRRTRIELPAPGERTPWAEVACRLSSAPQALCVVNSTADARRLFLMLRNATPEGSFHISSRLCPRHRRKLLLEIRRRLDPKVNAPCRLVSTQLIEAGVDVDFPMAFRALGPLDSIIQTAGRCNREGRSAEPLPVFVFRPETDGLLDNQQATPYRSAAALTQAFLERDPEAASRLHLPEFYAQYFREFYGILGPESEKKDRVFAACEALDFPLAAQACRLVGDQTRSVLVKWGDGVELAEKLREKKHLSAEECRLAQQFSVNLYLGEFLSGQRDGLIYQPAEGWDFWVWNSDYDPDLGVGHVGTDACIL